MSETTTTPESKPARATGRFGVFLFVALFAVVLWQSFLRDRVLPPPEDHIPWQTDFAAASAEAKASGRPMLLDFTASWCPPCRAMKRDTWPSEDVRGAIESARAIPVLLDIDKPDAAEVARRFNVVEIPTIVLLDPDGSVRDVGSMMSAREMVAFVGGASTSSN